ncbi:helix-turn-helix domain-containing protein [Tamlana sp. I1]|uniref:helix-turn-helix domain-containing protein n=1 Tax=Tamlana sp. I1 TaxID=2762061 RepID=UPI00188EE064|nr:helix-turn-helix domain-containing protein [Tamlana sp. I1]
MTDLNVNLQDYLQMIVKQAVQNSIPETAKAAADLIKKDLQENDPDELLTPNEAVKLLRCSITSLWRYEKSGKVKSVTIGGKRLYRRSDLLEALSK